MSGFRSSFKSTGYTHTVLKRESNIGTNITSIRKHPNTEGELVSAPESLSLKSNRFVFSLENVCRTLQNLVTELFAKCACNKEL